MQFHHPTNVMTRSVIDFISALVAWQVYWLSLLGRTARPGTKQLRSAIGPRSLCGRYDVVSRSGFELASVGGFGEEMGRARGDTGV